MSVSASSALAGFSGHYTTYRYAGKEYRVSYLTQAKKAEFERWLRQQILDTLPKLREVLPAEEYEHEKRQLFHGLATAKYSFHGRIAAEAMQTEEGSLVLASILFGCSMDEMFRMAATKREEITNILSQVLQASQRDQEAPASGEGEGNG